jgi:hypothetical protein
MAFKLAERNGRVFLMHDHPLPAGQYVSNDKAIRPTRNPAREARAA